MTVVYIIKYWDASYVVLNTEKKSVLWLIEEANILYSYWSQLYKYFKTFNILWTLINNSI